MQGKAPKKSKTNSPAHKVDTLFIFVIQHPTNHLNPVVGGKGGVESNDQIFCGSVPVN